MARIAGVDLPRDKRIEFGLTYIYGIGRPMSLRILAESKVPGATKVRDLTDDEVARLKESIGKVKVEGDLRREVSGNIKRLVDIGTYRGLRHRKNLPVRGQRTKTNGRTRKGPRKTVGTRKKDSKIPG